MKKYNINPGCFPFFCAELLPTLTTAFTMAVTASASAAATTAPTVATAAAAAATPTAANALGAALTGAAGTLAKLKLAGVPALTASALVSSGKTTAIAAVLKPIALCTAEEVALRAALTGVPVL